jgi:hypothetical protein
VDVHVEREDDLWQDAANLVLEVEGVSSSLLARALLDQAFADERKALAGRAASSSASRGASNSSAVPYVAPSATKRDAAQVAGMREPAVLLCTRKFLAALCQWTETFLSSEPVSDVAVGAAVEANYQSRGRFYPVQIRALNEDGTVAVQYEDGDYESNVSPAELRARSNGPRSVVKGAVSRTQTTVKLGRSSCQLYRLRTTGPYAGVSTLPVSVHLPLHRLLAKLLHTAASGGVDLQRALAAVKQLTPLRATLCMEHPLRCLSFAAQVACGMWRRNGYTAANLAYNYGRAPLSRTLRDMDIVVIQVASLALGGNDALATLIDRFELSEFLSAVDDSTKRVAFLAPRPAAVDIREYMAPMLAELLKLLIVALTYLPVCLLEEVDGVATEGCSRVLQREIVHMILGGTTGLGQLQKCKAMVGSPRTISDAMLQAVIEETCVRREDGDEAGRALALKPESFAFFDPEFPSLTTQQQAKACDRRRELLKAQLAANKAIQKPVALVSGDHLPIPHRELRDVRAVLLCPHMFELLRVAVESMSFSAAPSASRSSDLTILSRVVHLVTLQIYAAAGTNYFIDAFADVDAGEGAEAAAQSVWHVRAGIGRSLLAALAEVWKSDALRDDVLYHQGLRWVLEQIGEHSVAGAGLLSDKGVSLNEASAGTPGSMKTGLRGDKVDSSPSAKLQLQKAAQKRALEEAQKRAAAAMAAFGDQMSDDSDSDESDTEGSTAQRSGEKVSLSSDPSVHGRSSRTEASEDAGLECIVCREKKSTPLGYLCFLQPSNVLRNAHFSCPDCPELMNVFRVVAPDGCKVYAEAAEGAQVVGHLKRGDHVLSENRDGRWLHITAPVQGWACLYCNTEAQAAGTPTGGALGGTVTVNLHPVSDLQFAKHGGTRLHGKLYSVAGKASCWTNIPARYFCKTIAYCSRLL